MSQVRREHDPAALAVGDQRLPIRIFLVRVRIVLKRDHGRVVAASPVDHEFGNPGPALLLEISDQCTSRCVRDDVYQFQAARRAPRELEALPQDFSNRKRGGIALFPLRLFSDERIRLVTSENSIRPWDSPRDAESSHDQG
jgi:hypothetical protein